MGLAVLAASKAFRLPFQEAGAWSKSAVSTFNKDPSARIYLFNFLPQLISPLLIYAIEDNRLGNQGTLLALPSLFSVAMQVQGIGRIAPIYAILSSFLGFETPSGRAVPLQVAKSLIPAITAGFLIPTIMALTPTPRIQAWENWSALWQFAPPLFNLLVAGISAGLTKWNGSEKREGERDMSRYEAKDVNTLQSVYTFAFAVQATAHVTTMAYAWSHPDISLFQTFLNLPNPFKSERSLPSLSARLTALIKYESALAAVGYLGSQLYSIWDLRRLGYVKTNEAVKAGLSTIAGQLLVGPGATWAGLWYWREGKIATVGV